MNLRVFLSVAWWASAAALSAQTTQGLVGGRVRNLLTAAPVAGAVITYQSLATNTRGSVLTGKDGFYNCPLLPPGKYRIRAGAGEGFQAQEVQELALPVAGRLEVNFDLRPAADVFGAGASRSVLLPRSQTIVTFFGPDVDTSRSASFEAVRSSRGSLETSLSGVIEPSQMTGLPFGGRDLYTMLLTQPGVAADAATARGLGLSVNGQRPTSANFLLDGLENNNYTTSGPMTVVAPEAMQEYRVSTNNFSAEYGRASGFIANAVTKSGGNGWHGIGYLNLRDDALNANEFQFNAVGLAKAPLREWQPGGQIGGPILAGRLFSSTAIELLDNKSTSPQPVTYLMPTSAFDRLFPLAGPVAKRLIGQFARPAVSETRNATGALTVSPPLSQRRWLALQRLDWLPSDGRQRLTGRLSVQRVDRPDFIYSPYPDFSSGLEQRHESVAVTYQRNHRPGLVSEWRGGWSQDRLGWDRAHPEIPTLLSSDGTELPGSPASYGYGNRNRTVELAGSLLWTGGRHVAKFGGGALLRSLAGKLTFGRDGLVVFPSFLEFVADQPSFYSVSVARQSLPAYSPVPSFDREYGYRQVHLFAQDTVKLTSRLVLNLGIRYEALGSPRNTGAVKEALVHLGEGANFQERLASSSLNFGAGSGGQTLFSTGSGNVAGRFGLSYALRSNGATLMRMALGTFYDRPYDNLWRNTANNSFTLARFFADFGERLDYLLPSQALLAKFRGQPIDTRFPNLIFVDPGLRSGYSQSYLFGIQHELSGAWGLDIHAAGALSRRLLTTDIVNRDFSVPTGNGNFTGRYNPTLPEISYLGSQGLANYHAFTAVLRGRASRVQMQASYTWSHSIDNQSDPLDGDLFDLAFTRSTATVGTLRPRASFSRQFDSSGDRGNSDFDQRQNLVFFSLWDLPRPLAGGRLARVVLRDWKVSQMAAFRSGFPYSVFGTARIAPPGQGVLYNVRADLLGAADARRPVAGGVALLERTAFKDPAAGLQGTSGRNAFRAPGLYNLDASISRSFPMPMLGEASRVSFRCDFFNLLNHANLGQPNNQLGLAGFGTARFGREGSPSFFPALLPFQERGRQVQILLRLEF